MMLDRKEIDARFETEKNELLKFCVPDSHPTAFILGGQGASGKSLLSQKLYEMFALPFLFINGDDYRAYHPEHEKLISNNIEYYSTLTQPYSNVFTERLIQEAIKNKFNVIIEGTMRNPSVSQNTADKFKKKRFKVNVAVIAAHPLLTELNCYLRFFNEVDLKGKGRLANIDSHNLAAINMPKTVDLLFDRKNVNAIFIFQAYPVQLIKQYDCENGNWNDNVKPSEIIKKNERDKSITNRLPNDY